MPITPKYQFYCYCVINVEIVIFHNKAADANASPSYIISSIFELFGFKMFQLAMFY